MYYLLNNNGEYVGITTILPKQNFTAIPLKPLRDDERAAFVDGEWKYSFQQKHYDCTCENVVAICRELWFNIYVNSVMPRCGDIVLNKDTNVSMLIPCYNKADFIMDAVRSCLNQTQSFKQIIVLLMDEESIKLKSSLEALNEKVKCFTHERLNASAARTYLVNELCETEWFMFLDADDTLFEDCLEKLYNSDATVSFPTFRRLDEDNNVSQYESVIDYAPVAYGKPCGAMYNNLTSLMCKTVFNEIGLDEDLSSGGEDFDFIIRLFKQKKYKIAYVPETHYYYRDTSDGLTKSVNFTISHNNALLKNLDFIHDEFVAYRGYHEFEDAFYNKPTMDTMVKVIPNEKLIRSFVTEKINLIQYELSQSKLREPMATYSEDTFTFVGTSNNDDTLVWGRTFDVLFTSDLSENNVFGNGLSFFINNDILPEIEGMTDYDTVLYLLRNYSCFLGSENQGESVEYSTAYEMIKQSNISDVAREQIRLIELPKLDYSNVEIKNKHISFILHGECNRRCSYCNSITCSNSLSDDEIYNNFDESITYLEENVGYRFIPQILGGEPTLWSDYLINKIVERLKDYREYILFSNGTNKNSLWYRQDNCLIMSHLIDWKEYLTSEKIRRVDLGLKKNETPIIVVTHSDLNDVKSFVEKCDNFELLNVKLSPCTQSTPEYNMTVEDIDLLNQIEFGEDGVIPNRCYENNIISVDCNTMMYYSCCKSPNKVPLTEFRDCVCDCSNCVFQDR